MPAQHLHARLEALYGVRELPRAAGVLHVAAVWAERPDRLTVLEITAQTPKSDDDAFALSLARARADAVLTTGAILRA